jgi:signal transduction histidine kinase/streptogramin lyase
VIWAGSKGAINRIDLKSGRYTVQAISENTVVTAIIADRSGQFWIGTGDGSLFRFNPATQNSVVYGHNAANSSGCGNNEVRALLVDHLGTLWAGSGDSLCSFDPAANRFRVYNAGVEYPNKIDAIGEDTAGKLWVGSRNSGLHRFDPATGKFTTFRHSVKEGSLSNDAVTSILVDRSGTIWAGTVDGLNRLDAATGKFTVYLARDGLPSSVINGVVEDASGDLWIATTYGLSHFRPRSRTFNNYYRSDGVLDDLTGAWKGRSGQLFFGSYDGLTALSPDGADEKLVTPRVVLTNFQISDKPVPVGPDSPLKESISVARALTLSSSENTLSFEFADLSYADPERTRYRYRLGRLESGWNEVASTQHFVRYSTLAPGEYVFQVEARTSSGNWTGKGAEVRIVILPPWWSTWQCRLAYALALGLMMWFSWRLRVRQLAKQFNLQFEERLRERTRIARELHDTLLQSFHGLMLQFRAVYNLLPSRPAEAQETLEGALDQARQAITEGRDAVQGLRESAIEANDLAQALTTLGEELNGGEINRNSELLHIEVQGTPRDLHPIIRDEVYRIAGEALRNAFRHAQSHRIEVDLRYDKRQFGLRVRDDGKGIDPTVLKEGRTGHFGLPGMRERAGRIGGNLEVWSELESGTELELTVPGSIAYTASRTRRGSGCLPGRWK